MGYKSLSSFLLHYFLIYISEFDSANWNIPSDAKYQLALSFSNNPSDNISFYPNKDILPALDKLVLISGRNYRSEVNHFICCLYYKYTNNNLP